VDAKELPGDIRPIGIYRIEEDRVVVSMNLIKNGERLSCFEVEGSKEDLEGLMTELLEGIIQQTNKLQ